jgi:hypothetical protein
MKKYPLLELLIINCLYLIMISCSDSKLIRQTDDEAELAAVKSSIQGSIGWAKEKDFPLLYSIIANDSNYLEVDPDGSIIRGFDQFKKNEEFWKSSDFKAIRYDIRDLKINLSVNRDVAWFYCLLDDVNEWKGQPASWINTRWTGVLEKREGKWTIVQMHFSFVKE